MSGLYYPKRQLIFTALVTILAGSALHFLYSWTPNVATALFSPVNESLWEHGKIVFWPYLLAALWINRGRPGGVRPWLLALPLQLGLMLALGYGYHILLGGKAMWVDIAIYIVVIALGFWLPNCFSGPFRGFLWALPVALTVLLGMLIALFTLWPPDQILFADLSSAGAWYQIIC